MTGAAPQHTLVAALTLRALRMALRMALARRSPSPEISASDSPKGKRARPSPILGVYSRRLLIGYFKGRTRSAGSPGGRRTSWRCKVSGPAGDRRSIPRSRAAWRLIDLETHRELFTWLLRLLANKGRPKGRRWECGRADDRERDRGEKVIRSFTKMTEERGLPRRRWNARWI